MKQQNQTKAKQQSKQHCKQEDAKMNGVNHFQNRHFVGLAVLYKMKADNSKHEPLFFILDNIRNMHTNNAFCIDLINVNGEQRYYVTVGFLVEEEPKSLENTQFVLFCGGDWEALSFNAYLTILEYVHRFGTAVLYVEKTPDGGEIFHVKALGKALA